MWSRKCPAMFKEKLFKKISKLSSLEKDVNKLYVEISQYISENE